jgi:hypothetical protein
MTISGHTITLARGDGTTDAVTVPDNNTTYSVGDGGLTQKNFTTTLKSKLDGIAAGANAYSFPYTVSASASNSTVVQRHSSGYIFANYFNTTPDTVSSGVTQVCVETGNDGYIRHGDAASIRAFIGVESGATADQSATEILNLLKTVDSNTSGLNADTLDGIQGSSFLRSDTSDTMSGELNVSHNGGATGSSAPTYSQANIELQTSSNNAPAISFHRGGYSATTLYEYDGELYTNPWTTRAQTGKLLSSGNYDDYVTTSYVNGLGINATTVDSLDVHTGRNDNANKLVRTDANGYIQAGWINTTSGANTTQAISRVYASQDGYIRYYSLASFGDQIASHINYNSLENKPTIPTNNNQLTNGAGYITSASVPAQVSLSGSGATTVSGTYPNFTISSTDNNTNTTNFNIQAESGAVENISATETVKFTASGSATVSRNGKTIDISSVNTNTTYTAGTGLTLTGTVFSVPNLAITRAKMANMNATRLMGRIANTAGGVQECSPAEVKVFLGIPTNPVYTDTNTWNANTATVAGYVAAPGANIADKVWKTGSDGTPAWRDDAGGISSASGSGGISASVSGTALSVGTTGLLNSLSSGSSISNLRVGVLNADTVIADYISAGEIDAGKMTIGATGGSSSRMLLQNDCLKIFNGTTLRVHIGNLANTTT